MPVAFLASYSKVGLEDFAGPLALELGWTLLGTQGTADYLGTHGIPIEDVNRASMLLGNDWAKWPREIFAALLGRRLASSSTEEQRFLDRLGIPDPGLVYVNPRPPDKEPQNPDIGGLSVLAAAAQGKRIVLYSPWQFADILKYLYQWRGREEIPSLHEQFVESLAHDALQHVKDYYLRSAEYHLSRAEFHARA